MCVCVYVENTAIAGSIKKLFVRPCVRVVYVRKVYWINVSKVGRNKKE